MKALIICLLTAAGAWGQCAPRYDPVLGQLTCPPSLTTGPTGPTGAAGATGATGPTGPTGASPSSLFTQTASATVTTNAETTLIGAGAGSLTIPAGWFSVAGSRMDICASGLITTGAVPGTVRIRLKFGSTVITDTGAVTPLVSVTNGVYDTCVRLTARTVGASGTVMASNIFPYTGATLTPGETVFANPTPGTAVTVDTTATQVVDMTVLWSLAATNSITQTNFSMSGPGGGPITTNVLSVSGSIVGTGSLNMPVAGLSCGKVVLGYASLTPGVQSQEIPFLAVPAAFHIDMLRMNPATLFAGTTTVMTVSIQQQGNSSSPDIMPATNIMSGGTFLDDLPANPNLSAHTISLNLIGNTNFSTLTNGSLQVTYCGHGVL